MSQAGGEVDLWLVGLLSFLFNFGVIVVLVLLVWHMFRKLFGYSGRTDEDTGLFVKEEYAERPRQAYSVHMQTGQNFPALGSKYKMLNYRYAKRQAFMSASERDFYKQLFRVVGRRYLIFPQVHLNNVLDARPYRQYHEAAQKAIRTFSVDFVLCDANFRIKCAIELDDSTHEKISRRERDEAVNRVFERAGLPLLRIPLRSRITEEELSDKIELSIRE